MTKKTGINIIILSVVAINIGWFSQYSLALNTTMSMPRGIYFTFPIHQQPKRGDIVSLCIPNHEAAQRYQERHYLPTSTRCASGVPPVLKPIVGVPNDEVRIDSLGTWVNGFHIANSFVFDTDSNGRPIQHLPIGWHKHLGKEEFFMLSNHIERSLDSRYYGTVHRQDFLTFAKPLFTL